ncbi:MAG: hypothetical protein J6R54_06755, partial [Bacteroidaceae bacterium]|nr:hypothetical protein [Bacteroidaceae bacterium]
PVLLCPHNDGVCKDAERQLLKPIRVFTDAILFFVFISTGSRTRGYSPFGHRVFQTQIHS